MQKLFSLSARLPGMRRNDPPKAPRAAGSKRKLGLAISRVLSCLIQTGLVPLNERAVWEAVRQASFFVGHTMGLIV